jgi:hypothetical protein
MTKAQINKTDKHANGQTKGLVLFKFVTKKKELAVRQNYILEQCVV